MTATSVRFTSMPMWVQVWGLPFDLLLEEVGREIGSGLGEVLDKPLRGGRVVASPEGDKVCIGFKYKRLVGLYY